MTTKLKAKLRQSTGKKVNQLREKGEIPAVLYGKGLENKNLELNALEFEKIYDQAGTNTIIDLSVDESEPIKTLIADLQRDPVKDTITHIDLKQIRMDEKITAHIEIELIGESPAVKNDGGVLIHALSELEIRCLPGDLIHGLKVSVDSLKTFDDVITVADLNIPDGIELIGHEYGDVVATVTPPKAEEEPIVAEPVDGEADTDEKGEKKADEEVGSEVENKEGKKGE